MAKNQGLPQEVCYALIETRRALGMNEKEVSRRAGLSAAFISMIEAGKTMPSVKTLVEKIAPAYGVRNIWQLFCGGKRLVSVVSQGEILQEMQLGDLKASVLSEDALINQQMFVSLIEVPAYSRSPITSHPGDEMIYVLSGKVTLYHGDKQIELTDSSGRRRGDLAHYKSQKSHYVENTQATPAVLLVIRTWPLSNQVAMTRKPKWEDI